MLRTMKNTGVIVRLNKLNIGRESGNVATAIESTE